jgi:HTH-type transcriptional regulator/antitoxin HigA
MTFPVSSAAAPPGFTPDWTMTPGEVLKAELDARGLTQVELAARTNLSTKHINQVIKGVASLSADTALRLERVLGISSSFWNTLEANYQDLRTRQKARANFSHLTAWLRLFPLAELFSRGVIDRADDDTTRIEKLLAFFRVADADAYDKVWTEPVAAGFRRAQHAKVDPYATAVWLRLGEQAAEAQECAPYDAYEFEQLLPNLVPLTQMDDHEAFARLQKQCAAVGVAVEFVPEVKGSRATGMAKWVKPDKAMILLSGRYRFHDSFWFSFFHEAAHLLLHPKRRTVVHLDIDGDDSDGQETAADEYAASIIIPRTYQELLSSKITAAEARQAAQRIGVHPGIVAGRLAHLHQEWRRYAKLRRKLDDAFLQGRSKRTQQHAIATQQSGQ